MAEGEEVDNRDSSVREQDRFLPIANISRIMKKALPNNAKIAKDAKETVQECVSEYISFITSECAQQPPPPFTRRGLYSLPPQALRPRFSLSGRLLSFRYHEELPAPLRQFIMPHAKH